MFACLRINYMGNLNESEESGPREVLAMARPQRDVPKGSRTSGIMEE
jgi:hypothetical protein